MYLLVCKDEGEYILATRKVFDSKEDAIKYKDTICKTRKPLIVFAHNGLDLQFGTKI